MGELLNEIGDFRGRAISGAVSQTKNGYPQLVLELHATDVYDGESVEFYPDAVDGTITAYLCLFGGKGDATLAVQQVIEVFGWDGASFGGLNELVKDLTSRPEGMPIGFTIKENTYEGNTNIQVSWIRPFDAAPGKTIRECTSDELKDLDKQYARGLQAVRGKAKVAAPKPKTAPKAPPRVPAAPAVPDAAPPTPVAKPVPVATGKSSKGKAWVKITTANRAEATDKGGGGAGFDDTQLTELWQNTIMKVAGDARPNDITREQWYQIQEECVAQVTVPF